MRHHAPAWLLMCMPTSSPAAFFRLLLSAADITIEKKEAYEVFHADQHKGLYTVSQRPLARWRDGAGQLWCVHEWACSAKAAGSSLTGRCGQL